MLNNLRMFICLIFLFFASGSFAFTDHPTRWKAKWNCFATLVRLTKEKKLPFGAQASLARSKMARIALTQGLITDKAILEYMQKRKI